MVGFRAVFHHFCCSNLYKPGFCFWSFYFLVYILKVSLTTKLMLHSSFRSYWFSVSLFCLSVLSNSLYFFVLLCNTFFYFSFAKTKPDEFSYFICQSTPAPLFFCNLSSQVWLKFVTRPKQLAWFWCNFDKEVFSVVFYEIFLYFFWFRFVWISS